MIRAAGILFVAATGRVLFLQRSQEGGMPGVWCCPGGKLEDGEDAAQAACREVLEEVKYEVKPKDLTLWTRRQRDDVDFTTFIVKGVEEFKPVLNDEHTAHAWAEPSNPPQPLHPGMAVVLAKCSPDWNELSVAQWMAQGELTSPQKYENIWLFDIRITGTGQAFRHEKRDAKGKVVQEAEVVWRDPSIYLNPEFIARCNGLPAVLEHPNKDMLDGDEYRERNMGSVFLPYQKGEEIWAITKIWDEPTAQMMAENQLSTSPAVVWRDPEVNSLLTSENGHKIMIEGKPSLLDHIAICRQGVWDKGGDPSGVATTRGDSDMDKAELEKMLKARADEQDLKYEGLFKGIKDLLAPVASRLDAIEADIKARKDAEEHEKNEEEKRADKRRADAKGRADAFKFSKRKDGESDEEYKERHDAEEAKHCADWEEAGESKELAADKARKRRDADEAEEKKEHEAKADKGRKDSAELIREAIARGDAVDPVKFNEVMARLDALTAAAKPLTDADLNAIGNVYARADSIFSALGETTPRHQPGQSLLTYRRDLAARLKGHTKFKDAELSLIAADEKTFEAIEGEIYKDAHAFAMSPATMKPGELRAKVTRGDSGHTVTEFYGDPSTWMNPMSGHVKQAVKMFRTPDTRVH